MTREEADKIQPGDEGTLRVKFARTSNGVLYVRIRELGESGIDPADIISHTPKALGVGDRVTWNGLNGVFRIEHIFANRAWIVRENMGFDSGYIARLSDLKRAP